MAGRLAREACVLVELMAARPTQAAPAPPAAQTGAVGTRFAPGLWLLLTPFLLGTALPAQKLRKVWLTAAVPAAT